MNHSEEDIKFLKRAVQLSAIGVKQKRGGPFGCVIVKNGQIAGQGSNQVTSTNDPTAHGQVVAIRNACKNLGVFHLKDCIIYTSCEPCPMCLGAIYWSNASRVVFANTQKDAANINFDDQFIYEEIPKNYKDRKIVFDHIRLPEALEVFQNWAKDQQKTHY